MRAFLVDLNGARAGRVSAPLRNVDPPRVGEHVIARDECNELYPAIVEAVGVNHLRLRLVDL